MSARRTTSILPHRLPSNGGVICSSIFITCFILCGVTLCGILLRSLNRPFAEQSFTIRIFPTPKETPPVILPTILSSPPPLLTPVALIPPATPFLQNFHLSLPDINTTPEEKQTLLPLFDEPQSLDSPPAPLPQKKHQKKRPPTAVAQPTTQPQPTDSAPISPPRYKSAPPPPYPSEMRASRSQGIVRVRIAINAQGMPTTVLITSGSGNKIFDTTAQHWILHHWRFTPATRNNSPVESWVNTHVKFILQD